jgi:hypothetical protein
MVSFIGQITGKETDLDSNRYTALQSQTQGKFFFPEIAEKKNSVALHASA